MYLVVPGNSEEKSGERVGTQNPRSRKKYQAAGAVNRMESIRSRIPPCPGRMLLMSFTPRSRLNADSTRSPIGAKIEMINARPTARVGVNGGMHGTRAAA